MFHGCYLCGHKKRENHIISFLLAVKKEHLLLAHGIEPAKILPDEFAYISSSFPLLIFSGLMVWKKEVVGFSSLLLSLLK